MPLVFSPFVGNVKAKRAIDFGAAPHHGRQPSAWDEKEIRLAADDYRGAFRADVEQLSRPTIWEDLYKWFDAVDLWEKGAWNLWRVLQFLCDQNEEQQRKYNTWDVVDDWAYDWCTSSSNRAALAAWDRRSDIFSILSPADHKNIHDSSPESLNILRGALFYWHSMYNNRQSHDGNGNNTTTKPTSDFTSESMQPVLAQLSNNGENKKRMAVLPKGHHHSISGPVPAVTVNDLPVNAGAGVQKGPSRLRSQNNTLALGLTGAAVPQDGEWNFELLLILGPGRGIHGRIQQFWPFQRQASNLQKGQNRPVPWKRTGNGNDQPPAANNGNQALGGIACINRPHTLPRPGMRDFFLPCSCPFCLEQSHSIRITFTFAFGENDSADLAKHMRLVNHLSQYGSIERCEVIRPHLSNHYAMVRFGDLLAPSSSMGALCDPNGFHAGLARLDAAMESFLHSDQNAPRAEPPAMPSRAVRDIPVIMNGSGALSKRPTPVNGTQTMPKTTNISSELMPLPVNAAESAVPAEGQDWESSQSKPPSEEAFPEEEDEQDQHKDISSNDSATSNPRVCIPGLTAAEELSPKGQGTLRAITMPENSAISDSSPVRRINFVAKDSDESEDRPNGCQTRATASGQRPQFGNLVTCEAKEQGVNRTQSDVVHQENRPPPRTENNKEKKRAVDRNPTDSSNIDTIQPCEWQLDLQRAQPTNGDVRLDREFNINATVVHRPNRKGRGGPGFFDGTRSAGDLGHGTACNWWDVPDGDADAGTPWVPEQSTTNPSKKKRKSKSKGKAKTSLDEDCSKDASREAPEVALPDFAGNHPKTKGQPKTPQTSTSAPSQSDIFSAAKDGKPDETEWPLLGSAADSKSKGKAKTKAPVLDSLHNTDSVQEPVREEHGLSNLDASTVNKKYKGKGKAKSRPATPLPQEPQTVDSTHEFARLTADSLTAGPSTHGNHRKGKSKSRPVTPLLQESQIKEIAQELANATSERLTTDPSTHGNHKKGKPKSRASTPLPDEPCTTGSVQESRPAEPTIPGPSTQGNNKRSKHKNKSKSKTSIQLFTSNDEHSREPAQEAPASEEHGTPTEGAPRHATTPAAVDDNHNNTTTNQPAKDIAANVSKAAPAEENPQPTLDATDASEQNPPATAHNHRRGGYRASAGGSLHIPRIRRAPKHGSVKEYFGIQE
ncbi:hypothetical protein N0V88_003745 [Collariella sp. IMI 366227]|nr:hypothetical protein N0V88_003745 [Collariella sp. IMI 366227]